MSTPESIPEYFVLNDDCQVALKQLPGDSFDSLVTDPPAGIGFMGKSWDSDKGGRDEWIKWLGAVMKEALRVMKPGAHGLVWALPRTSGWTSMALENAGFEIRDVIVHIFATGFPKGLDVAKAIDKAAGAEREVVGSGKNFGKTKLADGKTGLGDFAGSWDITAPATPEAKRWEGWNTALKPATEHWFLVRKPFENTVAANIQKHGTGALNIDASRIPSGSDHAEKCASVVGLDSNRNGNAYGEWTGERKDSYSPAGRWPANLILSHSPDCGEACAPGCPVAELDEQSEGASRFFINFKVEDASCHSQSNVRDAESNLSLIDNAEDSVESRVPGQSTPPNKSICPEPSTTETPSASRPNERTLTPTTPNIGTKFLRGSEPTNMSPADLANPAETRTPTDIMRTTTSPLTCASCAAPVTSENTSRSKDLGDQASPSRFAYCAKPSKRERGADNNHPTVKSKALMTYLIRLITPPGGLVLDPFCGSGSTGVAAVAGGWSFLGIEQDPGFAKIAEGRISGACPEAKKAA